MKTTSFTIHTYITAENSRKNHRLGPYEQIKLDRKGIKGSIKSYKSV